MFITILHSIHPSIVCSAYPIHAHVKPGAYPIGLGTVPNLSSDTTVTV